MKNQNNHTNLAHPFGSIDELAAADKYDPRLNNMYAEDVFTPNMQRTRDRLYRRLHLQGGILDPKDKAQLERTEARARIAEILNRKNLQRAQVAAVSF